MPICQKDLSANVTTKYRSHFARVTAHEPLIPGHGCVGWNELDTHVQLGAITVFHWEDLMCALLTNTWLEHWNASFRAKAFPGGASGFVNASFRARSSQPHASGSGFHVTREALPSCVSRQGTAALIGFLC